VHGVTRGESIVPAAGNRHASNVTDSRQPICSALVEQALGHVRGHEMLVGAPRQNRRQFLARGIGPMRNGICDRLVERRRGDADRKHR
jgi:hypothetical protein